MRKYEMLYCVGDSISRYYLLTLVKLFSGRYAVVRCPATRGSSTAVVEDLDGWLAGYDPDVVLFNSGLHDAMRKEGELVTPPDQYEANLRDIVARLQGLAYSPRLIWARTTPVLDEYRQFGRMNEDVIAYNEIADAVMAEMGVESIDLYRAVMDNDPEALLGPDGVHFTPEGSQVLGQAIADYLLQEQT